VRALSPAPRRDWEEQDIGIPLLQQKTTCPTARYTAYSYRQPPVDLILNWVTIITKIEVMIVDYDNTRLRQAIYWPKKKESEHNPVNLFSLNRK
jgi:hypothetical protein